MGCKAGAAEGAFEANIADAALKLGREERGMVVRAWRKKKLERRACMGCKGCRSAGECSKEGYPVSRDTVSGCLGGVFELT